MNDICYINKSLEKLAIEIETLNPDPSNARRHDERNLQAVKASLEKFGQRQPIVVQKQGMIVRAGNARLECARALGWSHIAAVIVDEDDISAVSYAIADNREIGGILFEKNIEASESFDNVDENIETNTECPKCGYEWSE